jgi:ribonuclease P protein component
MLAKSLKLNLSDPATKKVFRSGLVIRTTNLMAHYAFETQNSSFAVVVAKKTLALATHRNKWRRFLYDQIKLNLPVISAQPTSVVLRFTPRTAVLAENKLAEEVREIFLKISNNEIYN